MTAVRTAKKLDKVYCILKVQGASDVTIKQQWLVFILVLKREF
jgi:hypothetical protein